jgi:hypothetical protein
MANVPALATVFLDEVDCECGKDPQSQMAVEIEAKSFVHRRSVGHSFMNITCEQIDSANNIPGFYVSG